MCTSEPVYAVTQTISQSASSQFGIMQIDQREYDVSSVNSSNVKVSGTINNFNPTNANVTIVFTLPDGTMKSSEITADSKGNFETTFPLDTNSQKGTYTVYSSYLGTTIGALSFNVKQVLLPSSSLPTNPTQPSQTLSNNNVTNSAQPAPNSNMQLASSIPSKLPPWIKHIFIWYGQGQVSDNELLGAIEFLVQNKIININANPQSSPASSQLNSQTNSNTAIENQQNANSQITSTPSQQQQESAQPTSNSGTSSGSNNNILTNSDIDAISSNPNQFNGQWGKFSGKILDVETNGDETAVQLDLSDLDFGKTIAVYFNGVNSSQFVKDDCWTMEGKVTGTVQGQNAFNALLTLPTVEGEKMAKTSCLEALYLSLKNSTINTSQQLGNVKITVNSVEFAEKHTRVFITVQNLNADRKITFSEFDSYIVQGHSQYSPTSAPFGFDVKQIDTTILPGVIESGYVFFDPVPQNSFNLQLEADEETLSSDFNNPNFSLDQFNHKFTFSVQIQ